MTSSKSALINTLMRPISYVDEALIFANTHCLSCGRSKLRQCKALTWMILVDDLNRHSDLNVLRIDSDDITADKRPFVQLDQRVNVRNVFFEAGVQRPVMDVKRKHLPF